MLNVGGEFDGAGLLAYGLHRAGLRHAWLCEVDPWRRELLNLRFPGVPVYDDIRAVDAHAPRVDVIAGGFPCKGASTAGKRNGFEHPETVLWREMARTIRELRPRYVLVENVANILAIHDGAVWGEVVGDLAALGFDTEWDCFPAAAFGAPHLRDRVIAIATHPDDGRLGPSIGHLRERQSDADRGDRAPADAEGARSQGTWLRGRSAEHGRPASPNADGAGRTPRRFAEPEKCRVGQVGRRQEPGTGSDRASTYPDEGRDGCAQRDSEAPGGLGIVHDAERLGVRVEWGLYEAAIRRWETVVGPAPEPLCAFRGVDARAAARVERSRLSALGDGVQVQLGELAGRRLLELDQQHREGVT